VSTPVLVGAAFRDRYAVEMLADGGVLVDLATGTYLRLNRSAAAICSILIHTDEMTSATSVVAQQVSGSADSAERAIREVIDALGRLGPRREPAGPFRYVTAEQGGYLLMSNGSRRLSIDVDGTSVRLAPTAEPIVAARLYDYLRAIAPKLLFLQSKMVMHGAASRTQSGVRVISGESGAGKTTTARAFDAAGSPMFAQDMLVLAALSPLRVYATGEQTINDWAMRSAEQLARSPLETINAADLTRAGDGESTPVTEIWFIDGAQRNQDARGIWRAQLTETDGVLAVMRSLFLGGSSPREWRQFLSMAAAITSSVPLFEARMPAGVDRLRTAAQSYSENSAS
jgi:hypothetical protein